MTVDSSAPASVEGETSEWEYEYHSDEYEDLYITVNFPADNDDRLGLAKGEKRKQDILEPYDPMAPRRGKKAMNRAASGGFGPRRKRRRRNPMTGELEFPAEMDLLEDDDGPDAEAGAEDGEEGDENVRGEAEGEDEEEEEEEEEEVDEDDDRNVPVPADRAMRILDLATENPFIVYGNQRYHCEWRTMLGTDMFFAQRPLAPLPENGDHTVTLSRDTTYPDQVLFKLKDMDLMGISAAHLWARKADFAKGMPADTGFVQAQRAQNKRVSVTGTLRGAGNGEETDSDENDDLGFEYELPPEPALPPRAPLLARFNALRAAKGEFDISEAGTAHTTSPSFLTTPAATGTATLEIYKSSFSTPAGLERILNTAVSQPVFALTSRQQPEQETGQAPPAADQQQTTPMERKKGRKPLTRHSADQLVSARARRQSKQNASSNDGV